MPDRQFEAVLARLDRIADELARLNRHQENAEGFVAVARELRNLNESLNALAYAALGQSPRVRRAPSNNFTCFPSPPPASHPPRTFFTPTRGSLLTPQHRS